MQVAGRHRINTFLIWEIYMKIGILALQGAFAEHQSILNTLGAEVIQVRLPEHLDQLDGIIIPGGESTTISKLATSYDLVKPLQQFGRSKPVWGTCAGMIFLAKDIGIDQQSILGLMDISVGRNAFGRQVDSFETDLDISVLEGDPFHAVFIRAPVISSVQDNVDVLCTLEDGRIVAAQQDHLLVTAFHPELTNDYRMHQYFLQMTQD
jgi:pyridoxal 5'-phosphate synthase pdxT subunit